MHRLHLLLLSLLLLLAGCLEFDSQEITILHDAKNDRIEVHIVYTGLWASRSTGKRRDHVAAAAEDLEGDRRRGTISLFGGWPLGLEPVKAEAAVPDLFAHVDVETGALFTDEQGRLCAQQFVRIREARAFLDKLDAAMKAGVQANLRSETKARERLPVDESTARNLEAWCRGGERFLLVEPGRMELRLPLSDADHGRLKEYLVSGVSETIADEIEPKAEARQARVEAGRQTSVMRVLASNELSMVRETNLTRFGVGVKGADVLLLRKPPSGRYEPALHDHLVANGVTIERLDRAEVERRFAAFRTRDAVLAPDLAAMRAAARK